MTVLEIIGVLFIAIITIYAIIIVYILYLETKHDQQLIQEEEDVMTFYGWIRTELGINSKDLSIIVAKKEGKKKSINIAQIKEILKIINDISKDKSNL